MSYGYIIYTFLVILFVYSADTTSVAGVIVSRCEAGQDDQFMTSVTFLNAG